MKQRYKTYSKKFKLGIALSIITIVILFLLDLSLGETDISPSEILNTLIGNGNPIENMTIFNNRLPRLVATLIVGSALAFSGTIMQGVTNNKYAGPSMMGVSSGATLAIIGSYYFIDLVGHKASSSNVTDLLEITGHLGLSLIAVSGGLLATLLVFLFGASKKISPTKLILIGIAVNSLLSSMTLYMSLVLAPTVFSTTQVWILGSLVGANWSLLKIFGPLIFFLIVISLYRSRYLDLLVLGEEVVVGLGLRLNVERLFWILMAVIVSSLSIAISGTIGFLGLISPNIARKFVGVKHARLIPASILVGMIIMLIADIVSVHLIPEMIIPIGIVISLISAPYFLIMLIRTKVY